MTQLELVDGMVRGVAFLQPLCRRLMTVVGFAREAAAAARLLHTAGAELRVEPLNTRADLTGDALVVVTVAAGLRAPARAARAHVVWLSTAHALDHGVYVARGRIAARLNGHVEEICPVAGIPEPQLEPALAAAACALWAGLDPDAIGHALVRRFAI